MNQKWRKTGNPGVALGADDLAAVYLQGEGACEYCGTEVTPMACSFDHVEPFAAGGENMVSNLALCCVSCQRSKFTKSTKEFEEWRMLEVHCVTCLKPFRPRWADYKRGFGFYCSRKCSGKAARH